VSRIRMVPGRRWWDAAAVAGLLAGVGISATAGPTAQASPAISPDWTQQSPATSPQGLFGAAMTYDAATGNVVVYGGTHSPGTSHYQKYIWLWNGTTWTRVPGAGNPGARWPGIRQWWRCRGRRRVRG